MTRSLYWKDNVNVVQQHAVNLAIKLQMAVCANWTESWLTRDIIDYTQLKFAESHFYIFLLSFFQRWKPEDFGLFVRQRWILQKLLLPKMQAELKLELTKILCIILGLCCCCSESNKKHKAQSAYLHIWKLETQFSPGWQQKRDVCGFWFLDILKGFSTNLSPNTGIFTMFFVHRQPRRTENTEKK